MQENKQNSWVDIFLWSNHFYGLCAIALANESAYTLLRHSLTFMQLCFIYVSTLLYYTYAYVMASQKPIVSPRVIWYQRNKNYLFIRQCFLAIVIVYLGFFKLNMGAIIISLSLSCKLVLCSALVVSLLYYSPMKAYPIMDLRHWGVIKSLSIAWVWAIVTVVLPLLLNASIEIVGNTFSWVYFIHVFIFILILAILFDGKDLEKDQLQATHTIALTLGIKKMIQQIIYPLLSFYFILLFVMGQFYMHPFIFEIFSCIPILYLIVLCKRIPKMNSMRQNIFFIDGSIFLKTLLGMALAYFYGSHT
jgi:4-hydroxybenzoate polyprenyltransferase